MLVITPVMVQSRISDYHFPVNAYFITSCTIPGTQTDSRFNSLAEVMLFWYVNFAPFCKIGTAMPASWNIIRFVHYYLVFLPFQSKLNRVCHVRHPVFIVNSGHELYRFFLFRNPGYVP